MMLLPLGDTVGDQKTHTRTQALTTTCWNMQTRSQALCDKVEDCKGQEGAISFIRQPNPVQGFDWAYLYKYK